MSRQTAFTRATAIITLAWSASVSLAADPPAKDKGELFPGLITALKESPGCLGIEIAKTQSGKAVIFAWFENKKALLAFYYSDTHKDLMKKFFPEMKRDEKPLANVSDDGGPIMTIASLTPNDKPTKENPSPFKQIAIELYQPLTGGLSIGGKFAPENLKVPSRKESPGK